MLGQRANGKWSALTVGLCVGRQNGKNEILVVLELFGLIVLGEREILHTAHLQKAADTQFRRVYAMFRDVPELQGRMARKNSSYGMQEIELRTGQRIIFTTRQGSKTGRSLSLDRVVHDECMYISDADIAAVMPAMAAGSLYGNLQTVYVGSAPADDEQDHDGVPFARVREAALAGAPDTMWAEWSIEVEDRDRVPDEWLRDPEKLCEANPSLGIRMSVEWCEAEMRQLSRRDFLRERMGVTVWPEPDAEAEREISREDWNAAACHDESKVIVAAKTFGLDSNIDNTWASIGVAGARNDRAAHVAVVDHRRKASWIVDRCIELDSENDDSGFAIDVRGPLAHLLPDLRQAGLTLIELDTSDYAEACAAFASALGEGELRYPFPQPELTAAVGDARKQTMGDRWKWSRRTSTSADISPLIAVTLAFFGHRSGSESPINIAEYRITHL
jgi:hypothetical protein